MSNKTKRSGGGSISVEQARGIMGYEEDKARVEGLQAVIEDLKVEVMTARDALRDIVDNPANGCVECGGRCDCQSIAKEALKL